MRSLVRASSMVALLVALTDPARAQSDEMMAGARAAAEEGAAAFQEERYADAVDLFERAESLVHSPVHLLYAARSLEKLGSLVRAREAYTKVTKSRLPADAPDAWRNAHESAEAELAALKPRIPYVTIVVEGAGTSPFTVTMDGVQVPQALIGVPRPVDPGEHQFEAVAEGMSSGPTTVLAQAGRREKVVLTMGSTGAAAVAGVGPGETPPPAGTTAPPPDEGAPADEGGGMSPIIPWTVLGVGVVGLGVGTIFAFSAKSSRDDLNSEIDAAFDSGLCRGSKSNPECADTLQSRLEGLQSDGDTSATIATIGFIVGGLGIAGGATLLVLSSMQGDSDQANSRHITPFVGIGSAGLSGRF